MNPSFARPLIALAMLSPLAAWPQVAVSINIRPPPLPVYVQPPVPGDGYLWTPGYWGWNAADNDYFWVPGTWVLAPTPGYLWTPGYWGFYGGGYRWRTGYWGPRVGFYGGINYGFGYGGNGYQGGRWDRGVFHYNRSVTNVNTTIVRNVYNAKVVNHYDVKRVSFNGGPDGVRAEPNAEQRKEQQARHAEPTPDQVKHERTAMATPAQRASVNHGKPDLAATPKPRVADDEPAGKSARNAQDDPKDGRPQNADAQKARAAQEPAQRSEMNAKADPKAAPNTDSMPPSNNDSKPASKAGASPATDVKPAGRADNATPRTTPSSDGARNGKPSPAAERPAPTPPQAAPQNPPRVERDAQPKAQPVAQPKAHPKAEPTASPKPEGDGRNAGQARGEPQAQGRHEPKPPQEDRPPRNENGKAAGKSEPHEPAKAREAS